MDLTMMTLDSLEEEAVQRSCGSKNGKSEPQKSFWLLNELQGKLKQNYQKQVRPTIALRGLPLDDMKAAFRQSRPALSLG